MYKRINIDEPIMPETRLSSRAFNQDTGNAKKATINGPVIITDRGRPAHVLLTYDEYRRLKGQRRNILDILAMPDGADIDFEIPKLNWVVGDIDLS